MINQVYLSVGTNIGDRVANLKVAVQKLRQVNEITIQKISKIYETQPVGGVKQDDFLNIAVALTTSQTAYALLDSLHRIEQQLHRKRLIHWGPRTIDLDILYFNEEKFDDELLKIPHPEIGNRRFVLIPLLEITKENETLHQKLQHLLEQTPDKNWVQEYQEGDVEFGQQKD
jgi:2-amino-4-hydroxy-6-hydroxymethyldihydropteridine diphosphokinase